MEVRLGFIGGSGLYEIPGARLVEEKTIETPFGMPSDPISVVEIEGTKVYFLSRHGRGHRYSPTEINYRANIAALKSLGVTHIMSVSAVGSLKEEIAPGDMVLPHQFFDMTKGIRKSSFYESGVVGHTSMGSPICKITSDFMGEILKKHSIKFHRGGTYVCIEGPRFSTQAESFFYRSLNASVVGMTNVPEAFLAREVGISYATLALATDYDCWKEGAEVTVQEVLDTIKKNIEKAQIVVRESAKNIKNLKHNHEVTEAFKFAIQTKQEFVTKEARERLKFLKI